MGNVVKGNFGGKGSKVDEIRLDSGKLPDYAWPGGYPMYYITKDDSQICPDCANSGEHEVKNYDTNWEDPDMYCDSCNKRIPSAYAEDDNEDEE